MTKALNDMRTPRERVAVSFDGPGRTKQSFLDECDINFIMNKWKRSGELPPGNPRPPSYGDFSNVDDYLQAQNAIAEADQAFGALPSWIRARFQNDPAELLAFIEDPRNQAEADKLGLTKPPPPEAESTPGSDDQGDPDADPETPTPTETPGVTVTPP